jgi:hypothetical protein
MVASIPHVELADDVDPEGRRWRANVGAPLALDDAPPLAAPPEVVDVLCWNLALGAGDLEGLLARLRAQGVGARPERPLVLLLQEAYRVDATVPLRPAHPGAIGGGRTPRRPQDIAATAARLGLSLRYVPAMRNGRAPSDRGNAVAASVALGPARAWPLRRYRQRRVAVAATLAGLPDLAFVSVHLDVPLPGYRPMARRRQAAQLVRALRRDASERAVVLGGDLNTPRGLRDPVCRLIERAGFQPWPRLRPWRHTYHGPWRLLLDHLWFLDPEGRLRPTPAARLDEEPRDRGRVFGSDHHPLLASLRWRA